MVEAEDGRRRRGMPRAADAVARVSAARRPGARGRSGPVREPLLGWSPCAASWATSGPDEALPIVLEGLRRLEYRGYDSAGVAVLDGRALRSCKRAGQARRAGVGPGRGARRLAGTVGDGAHALGHARRAHRPQRPPARGLHGPGRRDPQRHHRELPGAPRAAWRRTVTRSRPRPTPSASRTSSRSTARRRGGLADAVRATVRELRGRLRARGRARRTSPDRMVGREGVLAAGGRPRRRRDAAGVRHPRGARPYDHRDPGRGGPDRRGPARRRGVHRLRRQRRCHPEPIDRGLGRRAGAEGRLRRLHAEGDPRAAGRDPRHAGRARRPTAD